MSTSTARPGRRATATAVAGLLALAAAAAGCTSGPGGPGGTDGAQAAAAAGADTAAWPDATPRQGLAKGLSLPLEDYMQTYQDTVVLERASRKLQSECMARYGFQVTFPPVGVNPPPNDNDANIERRYGITDRATAERYGYGLAEEPDQRGQRMPKLSEAAVAVLTGRVAFSPEASAAPRSYRGKKIPEGGCGRWAVDRIGSSKPDFSLVSKLDHDSLDQSQQTAPVRSALAAWSRCMKGKGYDVGTPYEAPKLAPSAGDRPSQRAVNVALADIDCKESVDLVRIWFEQDAEIQRRQIEAHQLELTEAKKLNESALKTAEQALRA
ncbi:hypothetical protein [Streptomyces sp. NPDC102462]|uniref:hypothetical protein n=1 Tax=Streptomyces sp. NPDC102462 TaxID=3366178 RepID=UPI00382F59FC